MKHSAQGLGRFKLEEMVSCQMDGAAPESGGGDPKAKEWDWNSPYWRKLGAPWGGTHCSAPDVARFLAEFLTARGNAVKPETAKLMVGNQNPKELTPRGLGFGVGRRHTPVRGDRLTQALLPFQVTVVLPSRQEEIAQKTLGNAQAGLGGQASPAMIPGKVRGLNRP
jgi:hypothetical protein